MNWKTISWKAIDPADLRRFVRNQLGKALKGDCLSEEGIAEEMKACGQLFAQKG
jgi:hypothetical protein